MVKNSTMVGNVADPKCPVCNKDGFEYKIDWKKNKYFNCGDHRWVTAANGKIEKVSENQKENARTEF